MNDACEAGCRRAATLLIQAADGEAAQEEIAWLEGHVRTCAACRAYREQFRRIDRELALYGDFVWRHNAPEVAVRRPRTRAAVYWIPALAGAVAASLFLGALLLREPPPDASPPRVQQAFVPIPYVPPLDRHERATVIRMDVPVAALLAAGYRLRVTDPTAIVRTEVLVGEDGRAHAVRLPADLALN